MCYFLTICFPEKFREAFLQNQSWGFDYEEQNNGSLTQHLADHWCTFEVTTGMCSCDFFSKPVDIEQEVEKFRKKHMQPKFRKKGWTPGKIERAIEDIKSKPQTGFSGFRPDVRAFLAHWGNTFGILAVYLHFYHGITETESLPVLEKISRSPQQILSENIDCEDRLVMISVPRNC